jgi:hypothetical protein
MTEKEALALVPSAQQGDIDAQQAVAVFCYNRWMGRLVRLYEKNVSFGDPAIGFEDLKMTFFEGCMRAVLIIDERGNPLYHVAQRAIWNVMSELRAVQRAMRVRARFLPGGFEDDDEDDWQTRYEALPDPDAIDEYERADDRQDAMDLMHVIDTAPLRSRDRQVIDLILSGAAGDPDESGFNQRLAECMHVSPQRSSQIIGRIRRTVES